MKVGEIWMCNVDYSAVHINAGDEVRIVIMDYEVVGFRPLQRPVTDTLF